MVAFVCNFPLSSTLLEVNLLGIRVVDVLFLRIPHIGILQIFTIECHLPHCVVSHCYFVSISHYVVLQKLKIVQKITSLIFKQLKTQRDLQNEPTCMDC